MDRRKRKDEDVSTNLHEKQKTVGWRRARCQLAAEARATIDDEVDTQESVRES